jgi:hypothetical protein
MSQATSYQESIPFHIDGKGQSLSFHQRSISKLQAARKQRAESRIKELQSVVLKEAPKMKSLRRERDSKKRMKSIERGDEQSEEAARIEAL